MKIIQLTAYMFVILALSSCKDPDTMAFNQVVKDFGMTIPDQPHTFVVLPIHSCTRCVKQTWTFLENVTSPSKDITIIDAYRSGRDPFVKTVSFPVYIDSTNIIESGAIVFSNPTVIHTDNRKVKSIVSAPSNKIEETLRKEIEAH